MARFHRFTLLVNAAATLILAACGGSDRTASASPDTPASGPTQVATPRIIEDEDLTPGLRGIDADKNGIRDDIDRLIAKKYSTTPALKKAAQQSARAMQKFMEAATKREVLVAGDEISRADECVAKVLPLSEPKNEQVFIAMSKEITALTANTKERFTAYWQANQLAGGEVFEQPKSPFCD